MFPFASLGVSIYHPSVAKPDVPLASSAYIELSKVMFCSAASSLGSILSANSLIIGEAALIKPFASTVVFCVVHS